MIQLFILLYVSLYKKTTLFENTKLNYLQNVSHYEKFCK